MQNGSSQSSEVLQKATPRILKKKQDTPISHLVGRVITLHLMLLLCRSSLNRKAGKDAQWRKFENNELHSPDKHTRKSTELYQQSCIFLLATGISSISWLRSKRPRPTSTVRDTDGFELLDSAFAAIWSLRSDYRNDSYNSNKNQKKNIIKIKLVT